MSFVLSQQHLTNERTFVVVVMLLMSSSQSCLLDIVKRLAEKLHAKIISCVTTWLAHIGFCLAFRNDIKYFKLQQSTNDMLFMFLKRICYVKIIYFILEMMTFFVSDYAMMMSSFMWIVYPTGKSVFIMI